MDFGHALEALTEGQKMTREGWNGQGMWLAYRRGYAGGVAISADTAEDLRMAEGTVIKFRPYIAMMTAQGDMVPWVASQSDILAKDWQEV